MLGVQSTSSLRSNSLATSAVEGRDWVYQRLAATTAPVIVDVGPGEGTYSILGRHLRLDAKWIGVEVYHPYIARYHLDQKYDEVIIGNVVDYDFPDQPFVVLLGDVIEHLTYTEAVELLILVHELADEIMVSVPIVESIQGEVDGNCHEAHLHQWSFEEMEAMLPGCESWRGDTVGRFWWKKKYKL